MTDDTSTALGRIKAALDYKHRHVQLTEAQARAILAHIADLEARAKEAEAREAELRAALELIDNSISAGVTETDGPARVKAGGDTRIEDGFIVGQFAIQFELIMKCVQNVCRQALVAAPAAPEKPSEDLQADKRRIDGLRELCGYVEDGSETSVRISQDDATRDWIIRAGKRRWHGRGLREAIDAALGDARHD